MAVPVVGLHARFFLQQDVLANCAIIARHGESAGNIRAMDILRHERPVDLRPLKPSCTTLPQQPAKTSPRRQPHRNAPPERRHRRSRGLKTFPRYGLKNPRAASKLSYSDFAIGSQTMGFAPPKCGRSSAVLLTRHLTPRASATALLPFFLAIASCWPSSTAARDEVGAPTSHNPAACAAHASLWLFRPTGNDPADHLSSLRVGFDSAGWLRVSLPFAFDSVQREDNVYGWYSQTLSVPSHFSGRDLVVDLGIIDDSDVTRFNGRVIGRSGSLTNKIGSAWNRHRVYLVPGSSVKSDQPNLLTVQVRDFGGIGGMIMCPVIGPSLLTSPAAWFRQSGPDTDATIPSDMNFDKSKWAPLTPARMLSGWQIKKSPAEGIYAFAINIPADLLRTDIPVDLGRVYDAAECYLNGKMIGRLGSFPPTELLRTGDRFRVILPAHTLRLNDNIICVRVFNKSQLGGLLGIPMVAAADLAVFTSLSNGQVCDEAIGGKWFCPPACARYAEYLTNSGHPERAAAICDAALRGQQQLEPNVRQLLLSRQAEALYYSDRQTDAARAFCQLDFRQPIPLAAALVGSMLLGRGSPASGVVYIGSDVSTGGRWFDHYGRTTAVLCAMNAPFDVVLGDRDYLKCSPLLGSAVDDKVRSWVGAVSTADQRALANPLSAGARRYASWDDHGETHPCDDGGPDLLVTLSVPSGVTRLSFYSVDWDWFGGEHPRFQSLVVIDEQLKPMAVIVTDDMARGRYDTFLVSGPRTLFVRIGKHLGPCAVLSGIFADRVPDFPGCGRSQWAAILQRHGDLVQALDAFESFGAKARSDLIGVITDHRFHTLAQNLGIFARELDMPDLALLSAKSLLLCGDVRLSDDFIRLYLAHAAGDDRSDAGTALDSSRRRTLSFVFATERLGYPASWTALAVSELRKTEKRGSKPLDLSQLVRCSSSRLSASK